VTALATPRRVVAAMFLAAAVLAAFTNCPGLGPRQWESVTTTPDVVRVPCRPMDVGGRLECTGTADIPPGTRLVIYEPAPGPGARMVREQIEDARGGTP
jgi:hypothetical protein